MSILVLTIMIRHPNVRLLLGYSRPDPLVSFVVSDAQDGQCALRAPVWVVLISCL